MKYKCRTIPFSKLLVTPIGLVEPLCNRCKSPDCSNPILKKQVSIMGVAKTYRLYSRGSEMCAVIECEEGFISSENNKEDKQ